MAEYSSKEDVEATRPLDTDIYLDSSHSSKTESTRAELIMQKGRIISYGHTGLVGAIRKEDGLYYAEGMYQDERIGSDPHPEDAGNQK